MAATRTDIHRPSSPVFDPATYTCRGVFDLDATWRSGVSPRQQAVERATRDGYAFAAHQNGHTCGHCGTHIRYAALLVHPLSGDMIYVGEDCLDNRFDSLTKSEFQALRKKAALNRARTTKREKINLLIAEHPHLAWLTYPEALDNPFLTDIADRLAHYGTLSDRQIAAVDTAIRRDTARRDKAAAEQAARQAAHAVGTVEKTPRGRVRITGTVISTRTQRTQFGTQFKMLVADDRGFRVYGTIPAALDGVDKGTQVAFTATVTPSDDDAFFGFYSRPVL